MKPYFYKIREITTGKYYVGCQYGKNSNPHNLFTTYFTSNQYIKSKPSSNFIIEKIIVRPDAREYEKRYLKKCYNILGKEKFLLLMINKNLAPGILNTPETIEKANIKKRISNKISADRLVSAGTHNFLNQPNPSRKKENREKNSKRMMGNKLGALRKITPELKAKLSEKSKGNTNVKGYKWWYNGEKYTRSICPPDETYYNKSPSLSEDTRKKISLKNSGRTITEEHKRKLSIAAKKRPSNSKGTIWVKNAIGIRKRVHKNKIPTGFYSVKENR
jgi:hypothetical protein